MPALISSRTSATAFFSAAASASLARNTNATGGTTATASARTLSAVTSRRVETRTRRSPVGPV